MSGKIIDLRLRKIERTLRTNEYDDLSVDELSEIIRTHLEVLIEPYGCDIVALRNVYACSPDPMERKTVKHLDDIIANIHELYPQPAPGPL